MAARKKAKATTPAPPAGRGTKKPRDGDGGIPRVGPSREPTADLTPAVAENLKRFRDEREWSLGRLAGESGVSRAMLNQIELGQSTPTINVLWKIATALDVPFSALLRRGQPGQVQVLRASKAWVLRSNDGSFVSRALFPMDGTHKAEFYELHMAPRSVESATPHADGTMENLVVSQGSLHLTVGEEAIELGPGDAVVFRADVPHTYENRAAAEVVAYLVMTYARGA